MRKIFLLFFLFTIFDTTYSSSGLISWLKNIPSNFNSECYEYSGVIKTSNLEKGATYILNSNKSDIIVTQNNKVLPIKLFYKKDWVYNDYFFEWKKFDRFEYRNLKDNNNKTFLELGIWTWDLSWNELILKFDKKIKNFTSLFNFSYKSNYYIPEFYISENWDDYKKVTIKNITDFSFWYLKIKFTSRYPHKRWLDIAEKVRIYELSFLNNISEFLFMSFFDDDINVYSSYNCNDSFRLYPNSFNGFSTDLNTKTIDLFLKRNDNYNVYVQKDSDNDWVSDKEDNCINVYNPFQKDINADGRWDLCSDDDRDWIIWVKDNCINVHNPDQKDINRNSVWDVCEFDKDWDSIFDSLDNCRNISNPKQKDDDKDWIWNLCDNCKLYNPKQIDKDNSWIWDVCEQKEKYILENDDDKDGIINSIDNCKNISNPKQEDIDKDWIWDVCDNCKNIQNKYQVDQNKNGVWDICEDSDNDWIDWLVDNCLNVANPDQKDSDNNWIWDLCEDIDNDNIIFINDNCPYDYNPDQRDTDNDKIWDKCDKSDDRFIESNKNIFILFMFFTTLIFFIWISIMLKKLWNSKSWEK